MAQPRSHAGPMPALGSRASEPTGALGPGASDPTGALGSGASGSSGALGSGASGSSGALGSGASKDGDRSHSGRMTAKQLLAQRKQERLASAADVAAAAPDKDEPPRPRYGETPQSPPPRAAAAAAALASTGLHPPPDARLLAPDVPLARSSAASVSPQPRRWAPRAGPHDAGGGGAAAACSLATNEDGARDAASRVTSPQRIEAASSLAPAGAQADRSSMLSSARETLARLKAARLKALAARQ